MTTIEIGVFNIDHPELTRSGKEADRFSRVRDYLQTQDCDVLLILEANSALQLEGYACRFSAESPFINQGRSGLAPNVYHQVGIYSRLEGHSQPLLEPVNGLLLEIELDNVPLSIYANVMTIKDQWSNPKSSSYTERVLEQLHAIESLSGKTFFVGGDFNCRAELAWHSSDYSKIAEYVSSNNWVWPTRDQLSTVQHVVHTPDLSVFDLKIDDSVRYCKTGHHPDKSTGLSDHPFMRLSVKRAEIDRYTERGMQPNTSDSSNSELSGDPPLNTN